MAFDYSRLMGKIVEKYNTQANFAAAIGLSEHTVSVKLGNKVGWKQGEILEAANLLGIEHSEIPSYFFTLKVQY